MPKVPRKTSLFVAALAVVLTFFCFGSPSPISAQARAVETINDQSVIEMVSAKVPKDLILARLRSTNPKGDSLLEVRVYHEFDVGKFKRADYITSDHPDYKMVWGTMPDGKTSLLWPESTGQKWVRR